MGNVGERRYCVLPLEYGCKISTFTIVAKFFSPFRCEAALDDFVFKVLCDVIIFLFLRL